MSKEYMVYKVGEVCKSSIEPYFRLALLCDCGDGTKEILFFYGSRKVLNDLKTKRLKKLTSVRIEHEDNLILSAGINDWVFVFFPKPDEIKDIKEEMFRFIKEKEYFTDLLE